MDAFETAVHTIQFLSAEAVEKANSGHPGTPMALAGIATEVFTRHLRFDPAEPNWPNRDRFVLSCGHASMLLYSLLHLAGYPVSKSDLEQFRQLDSLTPGHPEFGHTIGVETTTGPLGQGVANAVGLALASKMLGARVNQPGDTLIDYRVYVIASDGDLMEGVASEAASLAGQWQLNNLIVFYDANNITIDGKAEVSFSEDVGKRFEAYGWAVSHVDGHAPDQVHAAVEQAKGSNRPSLIVARTRIAIGAPTKENTSHAHGAPLGRAEIDGAKKAVGWPTEPHFHVPELAYAPFRERAALGKQERLAWQSKVNGLSGERKQQVHQLLNRELPADLFEQLVAAADRKTDATRSSGSRIEQRVAALVPSLIGGSADLAASTRTDIAGSPHVKPGEFAGRNLHFGVREHAMGSIANGLALGGFIPLTSTFLIFSDYMRPPIRLAAMMGVRSIYVFTHDSFYVGEDGPTHQPIEQLASLRLIPGLDVLRPADSLECAAAWAHATLRSDGPCAIALSRQNLPALDRPASFDPKDMLKGGYIVSDATDPTLVLIATGSEVSVAVGAKALLEQKGQRVRVVSMLCTEAFLRQPASVQTALLGTGVRRVSIEAGRTTTWRALVGLDGIAIGLDHYGASAPAEKLAERFGFTPAKVAETVLAAL